jgi:hypothetical protein
LHGKRVYLLGVSQRVTQPGTGLMAKVKSISKPHPDPDNGIREAD